MLGYSRSAVTKARPLIAVVDDEEPIRDLMCAMLASANYVCTQTESGKAALSLLGSGEQFELMLSDLMMPGMDGIALLESAKERFPDMPVIMVTAVTDVSVALGAIRNGAYDYLLKPFDNARFELALSRAKQRIRLGANQPRRLERFAIKSTGELCFVKISEIDWIEAADYYACLHVGARSHLIRRSMAELVGSNDVLITGASTAGEALKLLKENRFEVAQLSGNTQHLLSVQTRSIREHRQAVATIWGVAKHVHMKVLKAHRISFKR